jgi:homoserine O-acetyltransferase/O-succinyltransferase
MELSTLPRPQPESAPSEERCSVAPAADLRLFDVPVPQDLRRFGERVRASALGDPANPPVVVLGGISANCFPAVQPDGSPGWWPGLAGEGQALDPRHHYLIGLDFAADESGVSAPSTADQARVLAAALDAIGVARPVTIVGASYGGMVGLALAASDPDRIDRLVVICAGAEPHPASTGARELQRRVVSLGLLAGRGDEALAIARGMAMLTYRTPAEFQVRFDGGIAEDAPLCCSAPGAYLRARGQAFRSVMSPGRFLSLSASIDRHLVRPADVLAPCLIIGADSDQLVFPDQLRRLAETLGGPAELHLLDTLFGHDMFLKEAERIGRVAGPFLAGCR